MTSVTLFGISFNAAGVIAGLLISAGLMIIMWLVVLRPDALAMRVLPHVATRSGVQPARGRFRDTCERLWQRLIEAVGSTRSSVERRLGILGARTVADFRLQQVQWAAIGGIVGTVLGVSLVIRGVPIIAAFAVVAIGILGGAMSADSALSRESEKKRRAVTSELPDAVELLALAVGAGESIVGALERVTQLGSGAVHQEFQRTLTHVHSGTPLSSALNAMGERNHNSVMSRFTDAVVSSIEQGSGLTRTLHDQARDSRDAARRELLEEGGKAEIRMMIPVIFLILPVTVLFTLFPGLAALDFLA